MDILALRFSSRNLLPTFRLYHWSQPEVTIGRFYSWELASTQYPNLPITRRPTGGGSVIHGKDLTFSITAPISKANQSPGGKQIYYEIHNCILDTLVSFFPSLPSFELAKFPKKTLSPNPLASACFVAPVESDVLWNGRKIAGGALLRTKNGWLYQGSLQLEKIENPIDFVEELIRRLARTTKVKPYSKIVDGALDKVAECFASREWNELTISEKWKNYLDF